MVLAPKQVFSIGVESPPRGNFTFWYFWYGALGVHDSTQKRPSVTMRSACKAVVLQPCPGSNIPQKARACPNRPWRCRE